MKLQWKCVFLVDLMNTLRKNILNFTEKDNINRVLAVYLATILMISKHRGSSTFIPGMLNMKISLLCCRGAVTCGHEMFVDLDPALGR